MIFTPYTIACTELLALHITNAYMSLAYSIYKVAYSEWLRCLVKENGGATEIVLNQVCLRLQNLNNSDSCKNSTVVKDRHVVLSPK